MIQQGSNATSFDRYPLIFSECSKLFNQKSAKILSFGCSTGEEIQTLKKIYFSSCEIYGVEIDEKNIAECLKKQINKNYLMNYEEFVKDDKKFDMIFAMSCLCVWEETYHVECSKDLYPFSKFEFIISLLDSKLKHDGYLVIYNANYIFEDTSIFRKYEKVKIDAIKESGYVHKFDKRHRKIHNSSYDGVIFKKKNNKRIICFL